MFAYPPKRYSARVLDPLRPTSAGRLNIAPENIYPGVELVRDFLEGLVGLPGHDLEPRVRDHRGDGSTDARRHDDVEFP